MSNKGKNQEVKTLLAGAPEAPRRDTTMEVYEAIKAYIEKNQIPPSLRDLVGVTGLSSTSNVRYHVLKLEDLGLIRHVHGVARGISLVGEIAG